MTGFVVDDMAAPWTSSSPLWSLSSTVSADALGRGGRGMLIRAEAGTTDDPRRPPNDISRRRSTSGRTTS